MPSGNGLGRNFKNGDQMRRRLRQSLRPPEEEDYDKDWDMGKGVVAVSPVAAFSRRDDGE